MVKKREGEDLLIRSLGRSKTPRGKKLQSHFDQNQRTRKEGDERAKETASPSKKKLSKKQRGALALWESPALTAEGDEPTSDNNKKTVKTCEKKKRSTVHRQCDLAKGPMYLNREEGEE